MTPEEIEEKKAELLKDIQRSMQGLTRLSIRADMLKYQQSQIECNRNASIDQIINLMKEYYQLNQPQWHGLKDGEIRELLYQKFKSDEEIMDMALEEIARQQQI